MKADERVALIIPAYEPDEKLLKLCRELKEKDIHNTLVIDDGSGEKYRDIFDEAESMGFPVFRHAVNLGKGRALKDGFNEVINRQADLIGCVTADSDGQHSVKDIIRCMETLCENPDALILGCRDFNDENVPRKSELGNKITRNVFKYLIGESVTDTQTGLRAIPVGFMKHLMGVAGERYEFETNMLIECKSMDVPIKEIVIDTIYLENNASSHFNPLRDSIMIYKTFGKFLFASLSSSVIDIFLFAVFCRLFKTFPYYIIISTVAARIISAVYNYLVNYKVVFKSKDSHRSSGFKYFCLAVVQMGASALLVNGLYSAVGGSEVLCKIIVDVLLFIASFYIQREFVYKSK
ncbi:MAG: bifunctional glycosyltransferase family 2/GtrA family protein [Solobacterium sp.]|nr:bifunctional glycosyltransferase family 2/GtrA family protein [Solobacterium sp.]